MLHVYSYLVGNMAMNNKDFAAVKSMSLGLDLRESASTKF